MNRSKKASDPLGLSSRAPRMHLQPPLLDDVLRNVARVIVGCFSRKGDKSKSLPTIAQKLHHFFPSSRKLHQR